MSGLHDLATAAPGALAALVLVLARIAGMMVLAPVFGSHAVALRIRAAFAFFVAVVVTPVVAPLARDVALPATNGALLLAIACESVIGFAIGLVGQFLFAGALLAGELAGVEMGLGLSGLIDPQSQVRTTPIAEWQQLMALLVFLSVDGHHVVLRAVADSFHRLPLGGAEPSGAGLALAIRLAGEIFVVALKIASPVLLLVVLANLAMGSLARLIPQMNVMAVGFPVSVGAGLFALGIAQPTVVRIFASGFNGLAGVLSGVVGALG
ncbi:MAG TPA: flagellar biosynthetic protein FliR [Candidatus Binatia bacterium]|nr:flagellar biosynthetic protein FliR [Candidatus Binatia bacterium]